MEQFRIEVTVGHAPLFVTEWIESFRQARRIVHDLVPVYGAEFIYFTVAREDGYRSTEPVSSLAEVCPPRHLPSEVIDV